MRRFRVIDADRTDTDAAELGACGVEEPCGHGREIVVHGVGADEGRERRSDLAGVDLGRCARHVDRLCRRVCALLPRVVAGATGEEALSAADRRREGLRGSVSFSRRVRPGREIAGRRPADGLDDGGDVGAWAVLGTGIDDEVARRDGRWTCGEWGREQQRTHHHCQQGAHAHVVSQVGGRRARRPTGRCVRSRGRRCPRSPVLPRPTVLEDVHAHVVFRHEIRADVRHQGPGGGLLARVTSASSPPAGRRSTYVSRMKLGMARA